MRLLSLFDYSGMWAAPFAEAGWDVVCWDIKRAEFMDINLIENAEIALEQFQDVDGVLAAPPCTDFTVSGAQYWPQKDVDGRTAASLELVRQVQRLVDLYRPTDPDYDGVFFWACENPVGRMGKLSGLGNPVYFHPYEYAGYIEYTNFPEFQNELDRIREKNGHGVTNEETDFVVRCNAYTKKTGLWGEFTMPAKKPVQPVKCAPQGSFTQRYGGKSEATKEARSVTPIGFAYAFYEANKEHRINIYE